MCVEQLSSKCESEGNTQPGIIDMQHIVRTQKPAEHPMSLLKNIQLNSNNLSNVLHNVTCNPEHIIQYLSIYFSINITTLGLLFSVTLQMTEIIKAKSVLTLLRGLVGTSPAELFYSTHGPTEKLKISTDL